jgi:hypothetical protein
VAVDPVINDAVLAMAYPFARSNVGRGYEIVRTGFDHRRF